MNMFANPRSLRVVVVVVVERIGNIVQTDRAAIYGR
jgi:hypothetical protein